MLPLLLLLACPRPEQATPIDTGSSADSGEVQDSGDTGPSWPEPECEELVWHEGDLLLESPTDWEAFCEAGFNAVRGDLFADQIDLREPCLCEVSGHVQATIHGTSEGVPSREGLTQLRSVGSMTAELYDVDLPRLERAEGDLFIAFVYQGPTELGLIEAGYVGVSGSTLHLPRLVRAEHLQIGADEAYLPALVEVGTLRSHALTHLDVLEQATHITRLDQDLVAPKLHTVGTFRVEYTVHDATPLSALSSLELLEIDSGEANGRVVYLPGMPALEEVDEVDFMGCLDQVFGALGALKRVEGRLRVSQCEGDMSALPVERVGSLVVRQVDDEVVFPASLSRIDDKLVIEDNTETESIEGLQAVAELGGKLRIERNRFLSGLDGLGGLERVGGDLVITGNGSLAQSEAEAFAAGLDVEGSVTIEHNWDD